MMFVVEIIFQFSSENIDKKKVRRRRCLCLEGMRENYGVGRALIVSRRLSKKFDVVLDRIEMFAEGRKSLMSGSLRLNFE